MTKKRFKIENPKALSAAAETAEVSQKLTAWPITIDGKEHAIRISKAGNPVCDCGTASNHPHHIPAKTLENAFPPDHEIFKALPPSLVDISWIEQPWKL